MRKTQIQTMRIYSGRESRLISFLLLLCSLAVATFLTLTLVAMAHGQTRSAVLSVQYPQVEAAAFPRVVSYVTVTDSAGATVGGLTQDHFIMREDSVRELPLLVEEISSGAESVTVVLALDRSGSMEEEMPDARRAASAFVRLMRAQDQAALVTFAHEVRADQTFTPDTTLLINAINAVLAQGGTAINDAAIYCADLLQNVPGRRAIILMTDGLDKDSQATFEQAVQRFTGLGIPIFIIGLGSEVSEANLRTLAQSSGGRYYFSPTSKQLDEIYRAISALLHHSYRLTYTTHNTTTDGALRRVRVEVNDGGAQAFADNNYRAADHVPTLALTTQHMLEPNQDFTLGVEIPVTSKHAYNLFDLQFALAFDARYVRVKTPVSANAVAASFFGAPAEYTFTVRVDSSRGQIFFRFKRNDGALPVEGRGRLVQINFRALAALPDSTELRFELMNLAAKDKNAWPVAVQAQSLTLQSNGMIVWPGDTNNNGVVELTDVTALGVHWGLEGPKRIGAENQSAWMPHAAQKFVKRAATHADANGNGKIDERDLFPIGLNWRKARGATITPKVKAMAAPEGRLWVAMKESAPQKYLLEIKFQNISQRELAGLAFRMRYPHERVRIASVQSGNAWGSAPLLLQQEEANTLALALMIPHNEFTRASDGTLAEIFIHAAEPQNQEDFMFNEFIVVSPSGETRELQMEAESFARASVIPRELILHPAYPNPFRLDDAVAVQNGMRIQYDLPENAAVSVAIYNTTGQRVRLISAVLNKGGRHFLRWEGLSDMGNAVSSGLYLVKIEAAGESGRAYQATQKVTLVR